METSGNPNHVLFYDVVSHFSHKDLGKIVFLIKSAVVSVYIISSAWQIISNTLIRFAVSNLG